MEMASLRWSRRGVWVCFSLIMTAMMLSTPASAECIKETRDTAIGESGKAKLLSYLCKVEGGKTPALRVAFHRLSEAAIPGALEGKAWPEIAKILGEYRVHDNPVKHEAERLFQTFGVTEDREDAFHFQAFGGPGGSVSEKVSQDTGRKQITYLTYPDTEGQTGQSMALPEEDKIIRTTKEWPKDFGFFYSGADCAPGNYACTTLWRYLTADDVQKFEERWKAKQAITKLEHPDEGVGVDENGKPYPIPGAAPLKLLSFLTKDSWPEDFAVVTGEYNGCGGGYDFTYFPRQLVADVALLENVSENAVNIGELLGSQSETNGLRAPVPAIRGVVAAGVVPIPGAVGTLEPGAKILVPLKLIFVAPSGLAKRFSGTMATSRSIFEKFEKLPTNTTIKEEVEGDSYKLAKARESFLPPTLPKVPPYAWGPEIALKGAMVDGQRMILDETNANYIEVTAGEGYGSCPFLYAYDEAERIWVNHGKIIDKADAARKEMTQEIVLSKFTSRFRLQEEELELARINRVVLNVTLNDGATLLLEPDDKRLAKADSAYVQIPAGHAVNISFALPSGYTEADVKASKLSVTGYYRRYSTLDLLAQDARQPH